VEHKRRALRLKAMKYFLTDNSLWWGNLDGVILRCGDKEKANKLMINLHLGNCGGHFAACITTHNILMAGYY